MTTNALKNWFEQHKSIIEAQYQAELDKLAGEDEEKLESIACAFDPDYQYELERDNNL
jgi:hypothetical protein